MCPVCEQGNPVEGIWCCDGCRDKLEAERHSVYKFQSYPLKPSPLWNKK